MATESLRERTGLEPDGSGSEQQLEEWKEDVRAEWTDPATVAGWTKWRAPFVRWGGEAKQLLLDAARVEPGMEVLDLASGTGEPAPTLAELVGPTGRVTATDLGPGMLAVAEAEARQAGLRNLSFAVADVHELPFPGESFNRVTCRFGVMYFADVQRALGECRRVLRPGGRIAFTAWGRSSRTPLRPALSDPSWSG